MSIIADETQDITGQEQFTIVLRYVDRYFEIHKDFVGFYGLTDSTGLTIAKAIEDVTVRLNLKMDNVRALGFDGRSNMKGTIKGDRGVIKQKYPLAEYIRYSNHSLNLALQHTCKAHNLVLDGLEHTRLTAKFLRESSKRRERLRAICSGLMNSVENSDDEAYTQVVSICPTRWTVRVRGLKTIYNIK